MDVVPNESIRAQVERLVSRPVELRALALAFAESSASSTEVLVEGRAFYPRMLEDIAAASTSIHINQFGFRPGIVGDEFAEALIAKAAAGVPVRLVVDRQGSDPEGGAREHYDRLAQAGVECAWYAPRNRGLRAGRSVVAARLAGTWRGSGTSTIARSWWSTVASAGSVVPGSRITPGRPLPRPVRPRHRPGGRAAPARLRGQLSLARRRGSRR